MAKKLDFMQGPQKKQKPASPTLLSLIRAQPDMGDLVVKLMTLEAIKLAATVSAEFTDFCIRRKLNGDITLTYIEFLGLLKKDNLNLFRLCLSEIRKLENSNSLYSSIVFYGARKIAQFFLEKDELTDKWALLFACRLGDLARVVEILRGPKIDLTGAVLQAVHSGHTDIVKVLLSKSQADPSEFWNSPIRVAAELGWTDIVAILLQDPRVSPQARDNEALQNACENGHVEIVRLLLADPRVAVRFTQDKQLIAAVRHGHTEIAKLLLAHENARPSAQCNLALQTAAQFGNVEIVRLLLAHPRTDIGKDARKILKAAAKAGRVDIVQLLLEDGRFDVEEYRTVITAFINKNWQSF